MEEVPVQTRRDRVKVMDTSSHRFTMWPGHPGLRERTTMRSGIHELGTASGPAKVGRIN